MAWKRSSVRLRAPPPLFKNRMAEFFPSGPCEPTLSSNPACNPACRVCHYKHLDYASQLKRKQSWAVEQLGHWGDALREIRPAPEPERLGYRAKSWMRSSYQEDA